MKRCLALSVLLLCVGSPRSALMAQNAAPPSPTAPNPAGAPPSQTPAPHADDSDRLTQEQLDQLVAPIALYPDQLLSQILMASTYPLEIVQADRWLKANKDLKDEALAKALEGQTWDASVKSLVQFPDVLSMMSEKLDITSKIGDAFIAQQKDMMDAIQRLRAKAKDAGNLQSNQQQTVTVEPAAAGSQTQTIVIESAQPEVVYVPQYNPTVVYGAWPYPAYPPYPYYPPGYVAGAAAISFGVGVACGAIWANNSWGNCNWNNGSININNNFNRNTNIQGGNRNNIQGGNRVNAGGGQQWKHNPQHRQGVPYNNRATAQQFGGVSRSDATQARQQFRGRESGGQSAFGSSAGQRDMNRGNTAGNRGLGQAQSRPSGGQAQNRQGGRNSGAFNGVDRGNSTRQASSRGNSSRSSAASRPSSGSRPSPSRGGGSRGGGGRGGGGRR